MVYKILVWDQCGTASKAVPYNADTLYGHWFISRPIHFPADSLGKATAGAQSVWDLANQVGDLMKLLALAAPILATVAIQLCSSPCLWNSYFQNR